MKLQKEEVGTFAWEGERPVCLSGEEVIGCDGGKEGAIEVSDFLKVLVQDEEINRNSRSEPNRERARLRTGQRDDGYKEKRVIREIVFLFFDRDKHFYFLISGVFLKSISTLIWIPPLI